MKTIIFMDSKQFFLSLCVSLLVTAAYAQPIQLSNGDILDAELLHQTDLTITISHSILGEITIDKAQISNLQEINLNTLLKVADAKEAKAIKEVKATKAQVLVAKADVDAARKQLRVAKENVRVAGADGLDKAEKAFEAAQVKLADAREKLVIAVDAANAAEEQFIVAKNVRAANTIVTTAKDEVKMAKEQLKVAKANARGAREELSFIEESTPKDAEAAIAIAEEKVAIAEQQFEIAEEQVTVAEEKVQMAEDDVKRAQGEKVNDGFLGTGWFKDWNSSVELGLKGSSGSSVNASFRTAFNTRYEDDAHKWNFSSFYLFNSENSITSENRVNALLVKDWLFPDTEWFAFVSITYDWGEFNDWEHRLQTSVGPGYQFIKTDEWEFSARIGGASTFEFNKSVADASSPSGYSEINTANFNAMIGADLIWNITGAQHFTFSNYIFPGLTDPGQFRNLTNIAWLYDLEWFEGLALRFGVRNEYDTTQTIRNDFNYNFSLLWGF